MHGDEIANTAVKIGDALFKMFNWVVEHLPDLDHFADSLGGWQKAFDKLALVVTLGLVGRLNGVLSALTGI